MNGNPQEFHSILKRQLRKAGLDPATLPADRDVWAEFLNAVHTAYDHFDQDRYTMERSVRVSSKEMRELNEDLTHKNRMLKEGQAQLVQAEKMASLGQLAAGVAHEINNPMSFLISNLERMAEYVEIFKQIWKYEEEIAESAVSGDTEKHALATSSLKRVKIDQDFGFLKQDVGNLILESLEGAYRVKEIVQGLKSFARVDESDIKHADLNECIESTLKILRNELKYKCTVIKELHPLPKLLCYPSRLNQVFLNLLMNAVQAIPDQGEITISTWVVSDHIIIRISDTGVGMPPEVMSKLFTPFFTTKPVGKGTGLGLSISYGIVKRHNGEIKVSSEVGKGTRFTIELPLNASLSPDK